MPAFGALSMVSDFSGFHSAGSGSCEISYPGYVFINSVLDLSRL
jgi:hypothetical protein